MKCPIVRLHSTNWLTSVNKFHWAALNAFNMRHVNVAFVNKAPLCLDQARTNDSPGNICSRFSFSIWPCEIYKSMLRMLWFNLYSGIFC